MKQKKAVSSQKTNRSWKLAKLALILGCSLAAASFAPHAFAGDYEIDKGAQGIKQYDTFKAALGGVENNQTIIVKASKGTDYKTWSMFAPNTFTVRSDASGPYYVSGNNTNRIFGRSNSSDLNLTLDNITFQDGQITAPDVKDARGGAIYSLSNLTLTGASGSGYTFKNNNADYIGGAIFVNNISVLTLNGDNTTVEFSGNSADVQGGAIFAANDLIMSGENVNYTFKDNVVTTGAGSSKYGADIIAGQDMKISGTGTYTFADGVWVQRNLDITKEGEGDLILTTGETSTGNSQESGTAGMRDYLGVISTGNGEGKMNFDGVTLTGSTVDVTSLTDVAEFDGILFAQTGFNFNDTNIEGNALSAKGDAYGIVCASNGDTKTSEETTRYSTLSGNSSFTGNTVTSTEASVAGGVIDSNQYLFLGAKQDDKNVGSSNLYFANNTATGATSAEGGAIHTGRNVLMQSDNNVITFANNSANSAAGTAFGGAIASESSFSYPATLDEFGVNFSGNNNTVNFIENSATGSEGYGGAIAAYYNDPTKHAPMTISLGGTNSSYNFVDNSATTYGGAIYSEGFIEMSGNTLFSNNSAENGGAIYQIGGEVTITGNAEFTGNTADQNGGAIYADSSEDIKVNLNPVSGKTISFSGNTANGASNSIAFVSDTAKSSILNIAPQEGATVVLLDPIKVDQTGNFNNFDLKFNDAGNVVMGGTNEISTNAKDADSIATSNIYFDGGNITFNNDFSLVRTGNDTSYMELKLTDASTINVILDERDTDLALFSNATDISGVSDMKIAPTFESKEYVISDNDQDTTDNFNLVVANDDIKAELKYADGKTVLSYESDGPEKLLKNKDPNIARAAQPIQDIYEANIPAMEQSGEITVDQATEIYNDIVNNGQTYTAEGAIAQAFGAFDQTYHVYQKAMQLDKFGRQFTAAPESGSTLRGQCGTASCCPSICETTRTWGGYIGTEGSLDVDNTYGGFDQTWNGVLGGISKDYGDNGTLGAYVAWAGGRNNLNQLNTRLENDAYNFGLFANLHPFDDVNLTVDVNYGYYDNDMVRANATGVYGGSFNQNTYGTGLFLSKDYCRAGGILTPYIGARYTYLNQEGYDESGFGTIDYSNSLDGFNASSLQSWLGASFSRGYQGPNCWIWTPTLFGAWRHEYMDNQFSTTGSYNAVPGQQFMISSISRDRDMADLGFSISASSNQLSIGAGYNATFTSNYLDNNWFAGMSYRY